MPNLYEMLIPAAERTKKFYLGGDFDPVKVGLDTTATSGTFLMDTTLLGNSNAGHSFQDGPRGDGVVGPLTDRRSALGARRISEIHSRGTRSSDAVRRSAGNAPSSEAVTAAARGVTTSHGYARRSRKV